MEKNLINNIYIRLTSKNFTCLPFALKGGQMGVCIFMALYSRRKVHEQAWSMSKQLLVESIKNIRNKRNIRLLDGSMGTGWGIRYLALHDFLKEDNKVTDMYQNIGDICEYYGMQGPLYIIEGEALFSGGIYMAQLFVREETLTRYFQEERLIELIDECEKMLTSTIKGMYNPYDMPLSMLHSILFFLQRMNQEHIFPFLVKDLLQTIPRLYTKIKTKNIWDEYIYHFLTNRDYTLLKERLDISYLAKLIGEIGFYSLLYQRPELFKSLWSQLEIENPSCLIEVQNYIQESEISTETLCGWGYGLLCNEIE